MSRAITYALALVVTATALAMAVASAWGRADAWVDRLTLAALSACIVLAVHLLPALGAGVKGWGRAAVVIVWPLCLLAAMVAHAGFFLNAWAASAQAQAAPVQQRQAEARAAQRQALETALAGIRARSVTTVAAQLATARAAADQGQAWATPARVERLQIELAEAQRAARLRDDLVALAGAVSEAAGDGAAALASDPVTRSFMAVTGASAAAVQLAVNGLLAVLVEVLGCLLWWLALAAPREARARIDRVARMPTPADNGADQENPAPVSVPDAAADLDVTASELEQVRRSITAGARPPTETFIRDLLRCSPEKARVIRRQLQDAARASPEIHVAPASAGAPMGFVG
ncbi:hypothetical protein AZ34_10350 [Hylemonella gracilis str. Niagara R]|uniref:Uncharacterized protein n=1 Tax=Hylemonella gracilis str. Niagara R TaxID=1458275 RepID=A0A016XL86_9BURK|nr:hypothetical protein [Hylemonella gracilis]EYC52869.1 hypothetical protein AZ34_10350 [Hylemonella gracilis str. Niagara R]